MTHSFMLTLVDPSIDTTEMFNVQGYAVWRFGGVDDEDLEVAIEDAMAYNTRTRIEMTMPRTLKSAPRPRPSCMAQFQAYVLPQLKSRTSSRKQRREQHAMFQPVLTAVARAAQVKQDRAADAVQFKSNPRNQSKE